MTQSQAKSAIASVASSMNKKNSSKQRLPEDISAIQKATPQEETARQIIAQMIQTVDQDTDKITHDVLPNNNYAYQDIGVSCDTDIVPQSQNMVSDESIDDTFKDDVISQDNNIVLSSQTPTEDKHEEDNIINHYFHNNMIEIVRENIEKIQNRSFAFVDNIYETRIAAVSTATFLHETALETISNISNVCLDVATKSVSCETPTDFISHQVECVSKIQKVYSDMFSTIGKESYKTWRDAMNIFVIPKH